MRSAVITIITLSAMLACVTLWAQNPPRSAGSGLYFATRQHLRGSVVGDADGHVERISGDDPPETRTHP
jgi:hypothetical protein